VQEGIKVTLPLIFGTSFLVGFSGAMMPGPFLTMTIGETLRRGFWAGPLMVLGHGLLEGALVASFVAGLASLVTQPAVSHTIAALGGFSLCLLGFWTAWDAYMGRVKLALSGPEAGEAGPRERGAKLHPVPAGALVSLANPYWVLWWATIGLNYVTMSMTRGLTGLAVFYGGHILSDLTWFSLVSAAVAAGRQLFGPAVYKNVLIACGGALVVLGLYFLYSGLGGRT